MEDLSPKPGDLDPIEIASLDEIQALQLQRMKWSLAHAYHNVPHYKAAFEAAGVHPDEIGLVVPHQANLRIIESVAKHAGIPMERVMLTVEKYGNMSAATVPVALVEALEQGRVEPGSYLLMPAFGGGLTYCSLLVRWGDRVTPLGTCAEELPPCESTALELVTHVRERQDSYGRSKDGLLAPVFAETRVTA